MEEDVERLTEDDRGSASGGLVFESNEHYLGWELSRLRRLLLARAEARQEQRPSGSWRKVAAEILRTRPVGLEARARAVTGGVPVPLHDLAVRCDLAPADELRLLIALVPQLDMELLELALLAQGEPAKDYLTVGFVDQLFAPGAPPTPAAAWALPSSRLTSSGLLRVERRSATRASWLLDACEAPHHVAAFLRGERACDEALRHVARLVDPALDPARVILTKERRDTLGQLLRSEPRQPGARPRVAVVTGGHGAGKTCLVRALAHSLDRWILSFDLDAALARPDAAWTLELAIGNADLMDLVLHVEGKVDNLVRPEIARLLAHPRNRAGLVLLELRDGTDIPDEREVAVERLADVRIVAEPHDASQRKLIFAALAPPDLPLDASIDLDDLAGAFELTPAQIERAISMTEAKTRAAGTRALKGVDLRRNATFQMRPRLAESVERPKGMLSFDRLVLPPRVAADVQEVFEACRNQVRVLTRWGLGRRLVTGRGLVALFAGPAGTGKTLTAEVIAHELGLRLSIVSIPKVVSKWVGETEKNVRRVFAEARADRSILLFDEADSLFGKRVRVDSSQDQYQNMEVNNLLQEVERFEGIVLLTTNLEANIDPAFERRILYRVTFQTPDVGERERIWRTLVPDEAPVEGALDFDTLADAYELTGGQIKNAVVRALYRAAAKNRGLETDDLAWAAERQLESAGRLVRTRVG